MRALITTFLLVLSTALTAQTIVEKTIDVAGQQSLEVDLDFATEIVFKVWNEDQVKIEADVLINNGEDNDIFQLVTRQTERVIHVGMDQKMWEYATERSRRHCWDTDIIVTIMFPAKLELAVESISGTYEVEYYGKPLSLKTIAGDIDLSLADTYDIDFQMKTITGEIYSDLDLIFPEDPSGLRRMLGTDLIGAVGDGGNLTKMETISGNIYLRRK